ncbi:MAG: hypothetical protein IKX45_08000 [Bacteroidales bacterium]|nr:hypothetical protein [Bacteroidales bacterium]
MKAFKYILFALLATFAGCYVMDVPVPEQPEPVVRLSLDDDPYSGKEAIGLDYETSTTLTFSYEDISRIVATAPLGWTAVVKMSGGNGTLKISAPKYGEESVQAGDVVLKLYDGTGSFAEKKFPVKAIEGELRFNIVDFDFTVVSEFTLGSLTTVRFDYSPSFKNLEFTLPAGWKAIEKTRGTFTIIAPDLSVEAGDAEGTVTVTPVSWTGQKSTELARSFAVHVDATKPTFQFVDEETSFTYGETKELEIVAKGLNSLTYPEVPAGWTIDWTGILDGSIKVTAPARKADGAVGATSLTLSAVSNTDNAPISSNVSVIRLFGINNAQELLDFRAVYEAESADEPNTDPDALGKWLVDGALTLNTGITLTSAMLTKNAYVIKTLDIPLEGNDNTITLDLVCNAAVAGIFQYVTSEVRNLKLAGTIVNSYSSALSYIGPLAACPMNSTFESIECSVDITYDVAASVLFKTVIGGICGYPRTNYAPTFKNCKYSGTIHCKSDPFSVGGIVGCTDVGKPGSLTTVDHCTFSGTMIFDHNISDSGITPRVGGMLGDLARQAIITDCLSEGTITINANGKRFCYSSSCGVGGICGRNTAPASGYTMAATLKNVKFTGKIEIINAASNEDKTRYGQILGCIPGDSAAGALVRENWQEEGTLSL